MTMQSSLLSRLQTVNVILSRLSVGRTLAESSRALAAEFVTLLDVQHATVTLLDESGDFFRIEAEYPDTKMRLAGKRITIAGRPTQLELLEGKCIVAPVLDEHTLTRESASFAQIARSLDIHSMLIVPIILGGNTMGTVSVDSIGQARHFSDEDVQICLLAAGHAAAFLTAARQGEEQSTLKQQTWPLGPLPKRTGRLVRSADVADTLFTELASVVQFTKASLQLIIEGRRLLVGAFGFDKSSVNPSLLRPVVSDPIIQRIVRTKAPLAIADTRLACDWERMATTADVNSWLGIPLVVDDEVIAVATLDHDRAGYFGELSELTRRRIEDITAKAANSLAGEQRIELALHQIRAMKVVSEFAEKVATQLDVRRLLFSIAEAISQGLECTRCCVFLAEPIEGKLSLVCKAACRGMLCEVSPEVSCEPVTSLDASPVQKAFLKGEVVFIDNLVEETAFNVSHDSYKDARTVLAVPLRTSDRTIGAVLATHARPHWFSEADQLLLETLTTQAALAIDRDYGLQLVHSIGLTLLNQKSVNAVLKEIVAGAMNLTHTDSGVIYELSEDRKEVVNSVMADGSTHPSPRLDNPNGITRTVIDRETMIEISDIETDGRVNPALRGQYRSMFAIPLKLDDDVVGVLYLNGKAVRTLTDTERALLQTLAGQAALALQRARLDEQIRDSEAMHRSLLDNVPLFMFRKDKQSRFTWANAAFCHNLGKPLKDIIDKTDADFYPKKLAKKFVDDDRGIMRTKRPKHYVEENQRRGTKDIVWVSVVKTPVLDADGEVVGVQAIFWDITEERQMTERWRSLVKQSPDGIVVHKDGIIQSANDAAVRLFGVRTHQELYGHSILEYVQEHCRSVAAERLDKLLKKEEVTPMQELSIQAANGGRVDVEAYSRAGPGSGEVQTVFHDVTRVKTMLREMHHRVRRSLTQVISFLTRQGRFTKDPNVLHAFATLRERVYAMAEVHTVLYNSDSASDVLMKPYIGSLMDSLFDSYGSSIAVRFDVSAQDVKLNEKQALACGLIVTELVSNSCLHAFDECSSPLADKRIEVTLMRQENGHLLRVRDNGRGISNSKLDAKSMGLSLVRSLVVDDLKGVLRCVKCDEWSTTQPGTLFEVTFPASRIKEVDHAG